jgi:hypothetical protein
MNISNLSVSRIARLIGQFLADACMLGRFLSKTPQKPCRCEPLQWNQQDGRKKALPSRTEVVQKPYSSAQKLCAAKAASPQPRAQAAEDELARAPLARLRS